MHNLQGVKKLDSGAQVRFSCSRTFHSSFSGCSEFTMPSPSSSSVDWTSMRSSSRASSLRNFPSFPCSAARRPEFFLYLSSSFLMDSSSVDENLIAQTRPAFYLSPMNEERITNLEIRFSHQDVFIHELNQIVVAQQKTIERLEKEILDLKRSINQESGVSSTRTLKDDVPPHY